MTKRHSRGYTPIPPERRNPNSSSAPFGGATNQSAACGKPAVADCRSQHPESAHDDPGQSVVWHADIALRPIEVLPAGRKAVKTQ